MHYVGETSQHFCDRRKQHARDVVNKKETNGIYCHIKTHSSHQPDWDNFKFIDREKNWKSRKIKESLYINALNPTDFMHNVMNIEKGIAVNDCWMEFNTEIRGSIKKKMEKNQIAGVNLNRNQHANTQKPLRRSRTEFIDEH